MKEVILLIADSIIDEINKNVAQPKNTFLKNKIKHCADCGEAVEKEIKLYDHQYKVKRLCKCMRTEVERLQEIKAGEKASVERQKCFGSKKLYKSHTFEKSKYNDRLTAQLKVYCEKFKPTIKGLLFLGGVGTGKTFLASCIANELINRGYSVKFITLSEIINTDNAISQRASIIRDITHNDVVIIDDFGSERDTEYLQEWTYDIIDRLYATGTTVIVTTNATKEQLISTTNTAKARIYDRILSMCIPVEMKGTSIRRDLIKKGIRE